MLATWPPVSTTPAEPLRSNLDPVTSRLVELRGWRACGSYIRMPAPPVPSLFATPPDTVASVTTRETDGPARTTLAGEVPVCRTVRSSRVTTPSAIASTPKSATPDSRVVRPAPAPRIVIGESSTTTSSTRWVPGPSSIVEPAGSWPPRAGRRAPPAAGPPRSAGRHRPRPCGSSAPARSCPSWWPSAGAAPPPPPAPGPSRPTGPCRAPPWSRRRRSRTARAGSGPCSGRSGSRRRRPGVPVVALGDTEPVAAAVGEAGAGTWPASTGPKPST